MDLVFNYRSWVATEGNSFQSRVAWRTGCPAERNERDPLGSATRRRRSVKIADGRETVSAQGLQTLGVSTVGLFDATGPAISCLRIYS
jgi:hypothetical protein